MTNENAEEKSGFIHFVEYVLLFPKLHVLCILVLQLWGWLYHGVWVAVPLLSLFVPLDEFKIHLTDNVSYSISYIIPVIDSSFSNWLAWPQSWVGLHKIIYPILDFFPFILFEIIVIFGLEFALVKFDEAIPKNI